MHGSTTTPLSAALARRQDPGRLCRSRRERAGACLRLPARPPHILPYFDDVDSGYLHWVLRNIDNDQVRATARYHLDLWAAQRAIVRRVIAFLVPFGPDDAKQIRRGIADKALEQSVLHMIEPPDYGPVNPTQHLGIARMWQDRANNAPRGRIVRPE
jgi:hypothetical protein